MKILLTGSSGFVGSALLAAMSKEHLVYGIDLSNGYNLEESHSLYEFSTAKVDLVIHLAAHKYVDLCEKDPSLAEKNIEMTSNVINFCKEKNIPLIFFSSDKALNPKTLYGKSKLDCENLVKANLTEYYILRWVNLLGSTGSVLDKWMKLSETGEPVEIHQIDGEIPKRYFISIEKTVEFFLDFLKRLPQPGVTLTPDVPNISLLELAEKYNFKYNIIPYFYGKVSEDLIPTEGVYEISRYGDVDLYCFKDRLDA